MQLGPHLLISTIKLTLVRKVEQTKNGRSAERNVVYLMYRPLRRGLNLTASPRCQTWRAALVFDRCYGSWRCVGDRVSRPECQTAATARRHRTIRGATFPRQLAC